MEVTLEVWQPWNICTHHGNLGILSLSCIFCPSLQSCSWATLVLALLVACAWLLIQSLLTMSLIQTSATRAKADPEVTTVMVQELFKEVMIAAGSRDILGYFAPISDITWKQAPRVAAIVHFQEAVERVIDMDPNLILKHTMVTKGLMDEHSRKACLFTSRELPTVSLVSAKVSNDFRALLAQVRFLGKDERSLRVAMHRAGQLEREILVNILGKLAAANQDDKLKDRLRVLADELEEKTPLKKPRRGQSRETEQEDLTLELSGFKVPAPLAPQESQATSCS